ncbi:hypothetical protein EON65_26720 [archaeon]|nr:MAG: hypothetical protein EON65_26720 [archaeon]
MYKLELARTALLDEVSFLSGKNSQLEEDGRALESVRDELESTAKQRNVLLVLLGEFPCQDVAISI